MPVVAKANSIELRKRAPAGHRVHDQDAQVTEHSASKRHPLGAFEGRESPQDLTGPAGDLAAAFVAPYPTRRTPSDSSLPTIIETSAGRKRGATAGCRDFIGALGATPTALTTADIDASHSVALR